jgi:hypothetical protein
MYRQWGFDSFQEYVDQEVSFEFRKARYLMSIWHYFGEELSDHPDVFEKIKGIGWTKAAYLVDVVDDKNVDAWVELAVELPARRLNEEARTAKDMRRGGSKVAPSPVDVELHRRGAVEKESAGAESDQETYVPGGHGYTGESSGGRDGDSVVSDAPLQTPTGDRLGADPPAVEDRQRWSVRLDRTQKENVVLALRIAGEIAGEIDKNLDAEGYLLDFVATGFTAFHNGTVRENKKKHREGFLVAMLEAVERSLGVDIIAVKKGGEDVVYGEQTISRMEAEAVEGDES